MKIVTEATRRVCLGEGNKAKEIMVLIFSPQ